MGFFRAVKEILISPVVYVTVPGLVALHYAWFKLQQNEVFVPKEKQLVEQPMTTMARYFYVGFTKGEWDSKKAYEEGKRLAREKKPDD